MNEGDLKTIDFIGNAYKLSTQGNIITVDGDDIPRHSIAYIHYERTRGGTTTVYFILRGLNDDHTPKVSFSAEEGSLEHVRQLIIEWMNKRGQPILNTGDRT